MGVAETIPQRIDPDTRRRKAVLETDHRLFARVIRETALVDGVGARFERKPPLARLGPFGIAQDLHVEEVARLDQPPVLLADHVAQGFHVPVRLDEHVADAPLRLDEVEDFLRVAHELVDVDENLSACDVEGLVERQDAVLRRGGVRTALARPQSDILQFGERVVLNAPLAGRRAVERVVM